MQNDNQANAETDHKVVTFRLPTPIWTKFKKYLIDRDIRAQWFVLGKIKEVLREAEKLEKEDDKKSPYHLR